MDRLTRRNSDVPPLTPATSTAQSILNPKSASYHDDLYKAGFINKAQLIAAKSGKAEDVAKADAEAYKTAITNSIGTPPVLKERKPTSLLVDNSTLVKHKNPLTHVQSEVIGTEFSIQQRARDNKLTEKYEKEGFRFVKSSNKGHNCLIVSILQHLTGDYAEKNIKTYEKNAEKYREKINAARIAKGETNFPKDQMLLVDELKFILQEMKKEHRFKNKDLTVEIWTATANGEKFSYEAEIGNKNEKEKVIIFQKVDHFVPVLPPGHPSNPGRTGSTNPSSTSMTAQTSASVRPTGSGIVTSASTPPAAPKTTHPVLLEKKD